MTVSFKKSYSNFVPSDSFGAPLDEDELVDKEETRCWSHLNGLLENGFQLFNSDFPEYQVEKSLPIILCGFSKGCIVLNELCRELRFINSEFEEHKLRISFLFWLDGGHSGSSKAWLTDEKALQFVKDLNWKCRVYITSYQLNNREHIGDYNKFIETSERLGVDLVRKFCEKGCENDGYESKLRMHFELLNNFEICLA